MPEGDTLHRTAARLQEALGGCEIISVTGSHRAVASEGRRLAGTRVTGVTAVGKHLLLGTDRDWTLRTHLRMTGRWDVYRPGERWRSSPGKARVVVTTADAVAVCFAAPDVEIGPTDVVMAGLAHLGPDLTARPADVEAIRRNLVLRHPPTMADALLDQDVAAGIGNVFKSELLFLGRIHPATPPGVLSEATLANLYDRAHELLAANVVTRVRTTTGSQGQHRHWVYARGGQPCRRCGAVIDSNTHGPLARVTYWCPSCQPAARGSASDG